MADVRIISGIIDENGNPFSGFGFISTTKEQGCFYIRFSQPFNLLPAVTASQIMPWPLDEVITRENSNQGANIAFISAEQVVIRTGDEKGSPEFRPFSFIAVGT